MKINSISAMPVYAKNRVSKLERENVQNQTKLKVVSLSEYLASPISFRGRNKEQAIFYGAEASPFSKQGGVGTVMKDYGMLLDSKDEVVVTPYYRATRDKNTGKVVPLKDNDGDYVMETAEAGTQKLDLVAQKTMQWGKKTDNNIMLFRLKDEKDNRVHYFVFDETTAEYEKPYQAPKSATKFTYATGAKSPNNGWEGTAYAKNSKAFVELLPDLIADKAKQGDDFNPATVVCSDSQTAYTHEYLVQKSLNDKNYDEIKSTHIGHNLGPGYCGETSMQNMFVNLGATPEQIKKIESDPIYKQGLLGDDYFKPYVKETLDETGVANANQIALHYADKSRANGEGFIKSFSVVAEDYAESIATNPQAAYNIHQAAKKLYNDGVFNGILNPLEDPDVDATKKLPQRACPRYNEDCIDIDETCYPAFDVYPKNVSYEQMREIKNSNKQKLFERFSAKDMTIIAGNRGKRAEETRINPEAKGVYDGPAIKPELIDLVKQGKGDEVPLFVSWGRLDTQKGFDIATDAFEKFAKTPEGKNAVLIVGAGLIKGSEESEKVENKIKGMLADPDLQGRVVHIDGWAPGYAMASAADAALFTSRFEPCGLTDVESMKYYCTPIVTNTQGFKQKNFDPRNANEAHKATSFKTQHEYDLLKSQVQLIVDAYANDDENAKEKVKAEFPTFYKVDEQGNKTYDDSLFVEFVKDYKDFMGAKKSELLEEYGSEDKLPENWNDWDELSKSYSFKFGGFARKLKDAILTSETADAISAYMATPKETKAEMFKNLKALNTGWKGNAVLHPTNESSAEMYKKLHMMPDYSAPVKADVIAKDDAFIDNQIQTGQKNDVEKRVGSYVLGALTGVGAMLIARYTEAKQAIPGIEEITKQSENIIKELNEKVASSADKIKTLEQQLVSQSELNNKISDLTTKLDDLVKSSNKKIAIAAVAGAVGAAAVTFGVTKLVQKKSKAKKTAEVKPENIVEVKAEPKVETKVETKAAPAATPIVQAKTSGVFANFA